MKKEKTYNVIRYHSSVTRSSWTGAL